MNQGHHHVILKLTALIILSGLLTGGCARQFQDRPTLSPTTKPTVTLQPTRTHTSTLVPTITLTPSSTPTITLTPYPTRTATATATPAPDEPAELFRFIDGADRTVQWDYVYISEKGTGIDEKVNHLSAMLVFQLMDRAIHAENVEILGTPITIYYLNVKHSFDDRMIPMRLILGGTDGFDIPVDEIPAGGSAYVEFLEMKSSQLFEPWRIHDDAQLPYAERSSLFTSLLFQEFEKYLADLPKEVIIAAEHPILWPKDDLPEVKLSMSRISAVAARYRPFFSFDVYNRIIGPNPNATALAAHLLAGEPLPVGVDQFSAQVLIIVTP